MTGLAVLESRQCECSPTSLKAVLQEYGDVFSSELGTMKEFQAKLMVRQGTKPQFCHPRLVPYALKGAVEKELDRLEESGVCPIVIRQPQ